MEGETLTDQKIMSWDDIMDRVADIDERHGGALARQIGGNHYKDWPIQVVEFWMANWRHIPATEGAIVKYVCRWRTKGGIQDLKKARHLLDLLIEHEEEKSGKE